MVNNEKTNWMPPSVSAVRAFEAAARSLNFTTAARELSVTPSAISHSVRELEERLGASLFVRSGRRLQLTETGRTYYPYASEALGRLRAGDQAVTDPARKLRVLTVSVSPSFAAKWLVPRLGAFAKEFPDLDLRISANPQHIDFLDDEIDLAIRHGHGYWPTLSCTRLCNEMLFPVCSPNLIRDPVPRHPADLLDYVLIHHRETEAWQKWLKSFGVVDLENAAHGPVLNEMSLVIDAAIGNQGFALARTALVNRDIAEGRLMRPMEHEVPAEFGYWIVCPKHIADTPKIASFRDWLLRQANN